MDYISLLDGHVGEVDVLVVDVRYVRRVFGVTKPSKAVVEQKGLHWTVWCDEDVKTQIKLLSRNKQRIVNITGDDVEVFLWVVVVLDSVSPFFHLAHLVHQEYTHTSCFGSRLCAKMVFSYLDTPFALGINKLFNAFFLSRWFRAKMIHTVIMFSCFQTFFGPRNQHVQSLLQKVLKQAKEGWYRSSKKKNTNCKNKP